MTLRASTRRERIRGPAGMLDCAIDAPEREPRAVALIAHPHPLHGGTLDNKVVQTLARALVELGYVCLRPNFRGVGASEGVHDAGRGEVDDLEAVLAYAREGFVPAPPVLAGFSFGATMQARLAERLVARGDAPERVLLVAPAVGRLETPAVPAGTLVIHGERDETVPLAAVLDWARAQDLPIVLVPGADHFFHHRLHTLRAIVNSNWRAG